MSANAGTGESHSKGKELRLDHHRHRRPTAGRCSRGPARPAPADLLLRHGLRLLVDRLEPLGTLRRGCWPPALPCVLLALAPSRYLSRADLVRVHHDGHYRREGWRTPLAASDRAVAGRAAVVPVRPHRYPGGYGAWHDHLAGRSGTTSNAWPWIPTELPRQLRSRNLPRRTTVRGSGLARLRAAPPAARVWSFGRNHHPGAAVGTLAPARVFGSNLGRDVGWQ